MAMGSDGGQALIYAPEPDPSGGNRRLNDGAAFLLVTYKSAIRTGGIKIEGVLNPFASDINLFPDTVDTVKARIA